MLVDTQSRDVAIAITFVTQLKLSVLILEEGEVGVRATSSDCLDAASCSRIHRLITMVLAVDLASEGSANLFDLVKTAGVCVFLLA